MLSRSRTHGFILPLALVLGGSLLAVAALLLEAGVAASERGLHAALAARTDASLRLQTRPLIGLLEAALLAGQAASALLPEPDPAATVYRPVAVPADSGAPLPLHSAAAAPGGAAVRFQSATGAHLLAADLLPLSPPESPVQLALAWAAEDVSLVPSGRPPPAFWPLPGLSFAPVPSPAQQRASFTEFMDEATAGQWLQVPWIASGEALPFEPPASPALVPVVDGLGLRLGIFASGPERSREKVIRVRYYLEGGLWNPYNRDLVLHRGGSLQPVFRVVVYGLPEVRIHNRSMGLSTGWLSIDEAENTGSGDGGLQAWIRVPGRLAPGERWAFHEPDPVRQPEGLARTLHPGFMVGQADQIEVEFRSQAAGLHAVCLPLGVTDPMPAARAGAGWFRAEGYPLELPPLRFDRADDGPRPFVLPASLAFRLDNTHFALRLDRPPWSAANLLDPRRRSIAHAESLTDAAGSLRPATDLMALRVIDQTRPGAVVEAFSTNSSAAPFSWPAHEPASLLEAADLPAWNNGWALGAAAARQINTLLDQPWAWAALQPDDPFEWEGPDGQRLWYAAAVPVNLLAADAWHALLLRSALPDSATAGPRAFAAYPAPDARVPADYRQWLDAALGAAARALARALAAAPCRSVADFLDRGLLAQAFAAAPADDPLHALLPLRGWLRRAPPLRRHGAAWVLHLATTGARGDATVTRGARVWLLETTVPGAQPRFEVIRFEWTDPQSHWHPSG